MRISKPITTETKSNEAQSHVVMAASREVFVPSLDGRVKKSCAAAVSTQVRLIGKDQDSYPLSRVFGG